MTYPTQSQPPTAGPDHPNAATAIDDAPSFDDGGWGGPRRDAVADQNAVAAREDGTGQDAVARQEDGTVRTDGTGPQTEGAGAVSADGDTSPRDGQLSPGAPADDPVAALWGTDLVERYRDEWQQLQLRFVDDPRGATGEAAHLLDDAVHSLTATLADQKQALDGWQSAQGDDTEVLRTALMRYRDFLDRLLGL